MARVDKVDISPSFNKLKRNIKFPILYHGIEWRLIVRVNHIQITASETEVIDNVILLYVASIGKRVEAFRIRALINQRFVVDLIAYHFKDLQVLLLDCIKHWRLVNLDHVLMIDVGSFVDQ
jgi:hypothetical protein